MPPTAAVANDLPDVAARAWVLYDARAAQVLASDRADERFEPASLTKLMTAYLTFQALQRGELKREQTIAVSSAAMQAPGSRMFIDSRRPPTVDQLLHGLIVQSGNDAAVALAEALAGSEADFAKRMNDQARRLGLRNTRFVNASGLPDPGHYSSAADMARLAAALIRDFPADYRLYSVREYTYNGITQSNRNRLLFADPSVDGMKTGHTSSAGYCLVSSAKRGERRLIAVVLGTASDSARTSESQRLLNLGFTRWDTLEIGAKGKPVAQARVWKGRDQEVAVTLASAALVALPRGSKDEVRPVVELQRYVVAPVSAGQEIGRLRVEAGGQTVAEFPLVARKAIPVGGVFRRLLDTALLWFH